jgi:sec-independent protein translocase protein TatA
VAKSNPNGGIIMFGLGMPELVVIMFICLILFGGRKLPEIGSGLGKAIRNFRGSTKEANEELQAPGEKKNPS